MLGVSGAVQRGGDFHAGSAQFFSALSKWLDVLLCSSGPCPILHYSAFDFLSLGIAQDQTTLARSLEKVLSLKTQILILLSSIAVVLNPTEQRLWPFFTAAPFKQKEAGCWGVKCTRYGSSLQSQREAQSSWTGCSCALASAEEYRPNVSVLDCSTCAYMDTMPCAALLQGVIFPYFSKGVYVAKIFFNALDILLSILGCFFVFFNYYYLFCFVFCSILL